MLSTNISFLYDTIPINLIRLLNDIKYKFIDIENEEELTSQEKLNLIQLKKLDLIDKTNSNITHLGNNLLKLYGQQYLKSINKSEFNVIEKIVEIGYDIGCSFEIVKVENSTVIRFFDDKNGICVYEIDLN
jgi:hypothetical protein